MPSNRRLHIGQTTGPTGTLTILQQWDGGTSAGIPNFTEFGFSGTESCLFIKGPNGGVVREKYGVRLTPEERDQLEHMVWVGKSSAKVATPARIPLNTDEGWTAPRVALILDVAEGTVVRVKRRFAEGGLDGAIQNRPQAKRYRKLDGRGGVHLIALACSPAHQRGLRPPDALAGG